VIPVKKDGSRSKGIDFMEVSADCADQIKNVARKRKED
jgi:hypothetical protein